MSVLTQAEANTREEAKAQAILLARKQVVADVARKLDPVKAPAYLAKLTIADMDTLIRGMTIEKEEFLSPSYFARVRVTVMDGPILRAYGESLGPDATKYARNPRSVLVLPVFFDGKEASVWDAKTNLTLSMWKKKIQTIGAGALLIPNGDTTDRSIVDRDNALVAIYEELKALFVDYGVDELVVAVVTDELLSEKKNAIGIMLRRVSAQGVKVETMRIVPSKRAAREVLYEEAVEMAALRAAEIAASTSDVENVVLTKAQKLRFVVQFTTLKDWGTLQQQLRAPEQFISISADTLTLHKAQGTIYLKESPEQYLEALRLQGLLIAPLPSGAWSISSR